MKWFLRFLLSAQSLYRTPMRSLLCASSMAIGIAGLAILLGFGAGAAQELSDSLDAMGKNILTVNALYSSPDPLRGRSSLYTTLTPEDAHALAHIPGVSNTVPISNGAGTALSNGNAVTTTLIGTTPEFARVKNAQLHSGRFIDEDDLNQSRRVAVIGAFIKENVYNGEEPLGEQILIQGTPFTIVGILKAKGASADSADEDNQIITPLTTAWRRALGVNYLNRIYIQIETAAMVPIVQSKAIDLLQFRHGLKKIDFDISAQTKVANTQQESRQKFQRLLLTLTIIMLGLGGIGLLAQSILSVTERRGEIGLRQALGATQAQIITQFLGETLLLASLAALEGLTLAFLGTNLLSNQTQWPLILTGRALFYPFVICLGIALVSGIWPAWNAARLDPVIALRMK